MKKEPFASQLTAVLRDEEKVTADGSEFLARGGHDAVQSNLFHFATALKKNTSNVLFWVVTVVNLPRE